MSFTLILGSKHGINHLKLKPLIYATLAHALLRLLHRMTSIPSASK